MSEVCRSWGCCAEASRFFLLRVAGGGSVPCAYCPGCARDVVAAGRGPGGPALSEVPYGEFVAREVVES